MFHSRAGPCLSHICQIDTQNIGVVLEFFIMRFVYQFWGFSGGVISRLRHKNMRNLVPDHRTDSPIMRRARRPLPVYSFFIHAGAVEAAYQPLDRSLVPLSTNLPLLHPISREENLLSSPKPFAFSALWAGDGAVGSCWPASSMVYS